MTKQPDERWPRLAEAAADARDTLRRLIPRVDAALLHGEMDRALLQDVRAITERHSTALVQALNAPDKPRAAVRTDPRSQPLWEALEEKPRKRLGG